MKHSPLGALIRAARIAAGLDQAELARRMEVRQQAVSGWERGSSRPRQAQLPALCAILDLALEDVSHTGGYDDEATRLTQTLLPSLPFENLSADGFEAFLRDLLVRLHPGRTASRNGSTGYKQYGVDVFLDGEGQRVGVQCKRHKTFGPDDIRAAIAEVLPAAAITSGIIALSRTTATPKARIEMASHADWTLWDGEDLSNLVRGLPRADALNLVDTYFRGLREPFLGIREPSPWLSPEEYDTALAGRLGVDRDFAMVGRADVLQSLIDLASDLSPRIVLVGRGGLGKTRLLREFAKADLGGRQVVFAARGPIAPESFEALPEGAPVIIIDDAMDTEFDVKSLELAVRRVRPEATLVMSTRPRALALLRGALELGEAEAAPITVTIDDLVIEDAQALAREALGDIATTARVESLARVGYDCPFLIVVAAHLMREDRLTDADLASQTTLRREILTRFADIVIRGSNAGVRTAILEALAAIQPARIGEAEFLDVIVGISGEPEHVVLDIVDELEDLGLILRRGQTVRVVPDLLGDAVLERALVSDSGVDKRFARRLADQARGPALSHALRNVSIIDWHRRSEGPSELADVLWAALTEHALLLPNSGRISLGKRVAAVAVIYPDRALEFVDQLVAHPASDEDDPLRGVWGGSRTITTADVMRELAPLVANAGHHPDHLARAMRLLLLIGAQDARQENPNPDHAMRLLRELGEFHPRRPVGFNEAYVEIVGGLMADESLVALRSRLISLLQAALADDVTVTESSGWDVSISRQAVNLDVVANVRASAIRIATEALDGDVATVYAAIEVLRAALFSSGRRDVITDEFAGVVHSLRTVLSERGRAAGIRIAAFRALGWYATYGEGERRSLAREVRGELAVDDELILIRATRAGFDLDEDEDDEDAGHDEADEVQGSAAVARYHRSQARLEEAASGLVQRWTASMSAGEILTKIRMVMDEELLVRESFVPPYRLLQMFFAQDADLVRLALVPRAAPNAVDAAIFERALAQAFMDGLPDAQAAATRMLAVDESWASTVVSAVMSSREPLDDARASVVKALLGTTSPIVHARLLTSARWLDPADGPLVMEMLAAAPIELDGHVADAAAELLAHSDSMPWSSLSPLERKTFLGRFLPTPRLRPHNLGELLNREIAIDPANALDFLQQRIIGDGGSRDKYEPLPHVGSTPFQFAGTAQLPALIAGHVAWLLEDESWNRHFYGMQVLERLSAGYGKEILEVVLKLIRSRDEPRVRLAREILNNAPHDLVTRQTDFVADAIEAAQALPESLRLHVVAGLHGSAEYGSRSRSVGADDPEEVALRDGALDLAKLYAEGSAVRAFYEKVAERASGRIASERADDASLREPREWG